MMPAVDAPILVTGSHRSGTTWVGRMLALSPGVGYVHEPFFPRRWPGWLREPLPHVYQYICPENEGRFAPLIEDVLEYRYPFRNLLRIRTARQAFQMAEEVPFSLWYRLRRARPLLKDPIALMSAEWLAERFGAQVVVMIRHPAAFAGSLKRLDWPRFDFRDWSEQRLFLRDLAGPYEGRIRAFADRRPDLIDEAILLWSVIHHVIGGYRDRHSDWSFVRHEDLSEEPVKGFRGLYERLGLRWDPVVEAVIVRSSTDEGRREVPAHLHRTVRRDSRAAKWTWLGRLTAEEQERVREGTAEVAPAFYGEEDWSPPEPAP
jgi:hypothetical protein